MRVHDANYQIIFTPDARLIHHESISHQRRVPKADFERMFELYADKIRLGDPYFSTNLSYRRSPLSFRTSSWDTSGAALDELMSRLPQKDIVVIPDDLR